MISIIIPTFNRCEILSKNLETLSSIKEDLEVIVVDDGSTDRTQNTIKAFKEKIKLKSVRNKKNLGTPKSWNRGIKLSRYENLLLMNDDTFIKNPDVFIKKVLDDLKVADIVGFKIEQKESALERAHKFFLSSLAGGVRPYQGKSKRYVNYVYGCMAMKKDVWKKVNFDPIYEGNAFREESDFQFKARKLGFKILYDPSLTVKHKAHKTGGQRKGRITYWNIRNHIIFLKRHAGISILWKLPFYLLLNMKLDKMSEITSALVDGFKII